VSGEREMVRPLGFSGLVWLRCRDCGVESGCKGRVSEEGWPRCWVPKGCLRVAKEREA